MDSCKSRFVAVRLLNPSRHGPDTESDTETRFSKLVLEVVKFCMLMKEGR